MKKNEKPLCPPSPLCEKKSLREIRKGFDVSAKAFFYSESRENYIFLITSSANSEHFNFVAPSMRRSKS
jgi:hypothetical protein